MVHPAGEGPAEGGRGEGDGALTPATAPSAPPDLLADEGVRAVALVTAGAKLRAASVGFFSTLRIRREELFDRPLTSALRVEDRPALAHAIEAVATGDWPSCALEVTVHPRAREPILIRLELEPDVQQRVRIRATDLTAERTAAEVLEEQQAALSALTANALDIWALVTHTGDLRLVSDSITVHLGWSAAELKSRSLLEFLHPDDAPRIVAIFRELREMPRPVHHQVVRARHKDGSWRTLETTLSGYNPLLLGNAIVVVNARDVTARRRAEAALRESEAIVALAGGVAHDFNNLLMSILTWTDIAWEEVAPGSATGDSLDQIRSAADRATELVHQLLAYGRRQHLAPAPLDLGESVVRLKRWMDRVLGRDHDLAVSVPDAPWFINGDRAQLDWALTALIMHAKDRMPSGGTIRVAVEHATLDEAAAAGLAPLEPGDHVVVVVEDSGPLMDAEARRRIFEPFFSTRAQGERVGAGLGLAAVLGTVMQSEGMIEVTSGAGPGTAFRCLFPRLR